MSILIIDCSNIRAGNAGGGVTHISEILNHIQDEDQPFEQVIIASNYNTFNRIKDRKWLKKVSDNWLNKNLGFILLWKLFKFKKLLRLYNDVVLFVPSGTYLGNFHPNIGMSRNMLIFDKSESKRYGFSFHRLKFLLLNIIQTKAFLNNDLIIFISKYAKQTIQKKIKHDLHYMPIIHHGISLKFIQAPKFQYSINKYKKEKPFKFLYVSPITVYKHQIPIVKAFQKLFEEGFPVELHLVGGKYKPYFNKFKKVILNIPAHEEYITYHGIIPYAEIEKMYKAADGFIYGSSCENMPNILIEAMSAGLPICCSSFMPMPEFLGESAFYFNPLDELSIYATLKFFLLNPELRYNEACRSFELSKKYSWEQCSFNTFNILYSIKNRNYFEK